MENQTFFSSETAIRYLANKFGSADYNNWQAVPYQYWSFVPYGTAGAASYTFFADAVGTNATNKQLTNMPKAGSFGQQHFLLKKIRTGAFVTNPEQESWDGTDAETLYSDYVNGIFQAGFFNLEIQSKSYVNFPNPFLYAGGDYGADRQYLAGIEALTLSEAAPNVIATYRSHSPFASLNNNQDQKYIVDPNILIEAEQNFQASIGYPSGALAPVATGIVSATSLYIGVIFEGLIMRPVQ